MERTQIARVLTHPSNQNRPITVRTTSGDVLTNRKVEHYGDYNLLVLVAPNGERSFVDAGQVESITYPEF